MSYHPPRLSRPSRSAPSRVSAGILVIIVAVSLAGCASGPPTLQDRSISRKLDLRLRTALTGAGWSEGLGEYIRVIVRMDRDERPEDREVLAAIGHIGSWNDRIVTFTLAPDQVVPLAAYGHVDYIELSVPNAPAPPPDSVSGA